MRPPLLYWEKQGRARFTAKGHLAPPARPTKKNGARKTEITSRATKFENHLSFEKNHCGFEKKPLWFSVDHNSHIEGAGGKTTVVFFKTT